MSDYKRYISYVYIYKDGKKENNIGFVKMESRAGEVKLALNLKSKEIKDNDLEIYMFYRDLQSKESVYINLIKIDKCLCIKEEFSKTYKTSSENIFDSKLNIGDMAGVVILVDGLDCIGTEWDDKGIDVSKIKKNVEIEEVNNKKIIEVCDEKDVIMNFNKFNESRKVLNENRENKEKLNINIPVPNDRGNQITRIFSKFPGMYPFEDDEIMECVKIDPHDIGMFSMDKWPLANNSFLLHGYYTYRHLIFAKMRHQNLFKYILGVPGIFRDRERFMASMFGFNNFKGVRNKPLNNGEFGYWYLEIKL